MAFAGTGKIWMNGSLVDWKDATIHVASHALHYGTGVFEGIRAYDSKTGTNVFRLEPHMRRLMDSCRVYRMEPQWSQAELSQAVLDTVRVNGFKSCYIRPLVYRGYDSLTLDPRPCPVDASVVVWEWSLMMGAEALEQGIDVGVSSWTRLAPNTLPALAKGTANYANSALIKMQAMLDGYADAIALDESGLLSEGSGQNLFLVRDNVIYTPSLGSSVLQGITRETRHHARRTTWVSPCGKRPFRASSCTWRTKRSSAARLSRSPPFDRSTKSPSATASADRSPRRCSSASSASSAASCPTRTTG